jgi:hypothetical protein
MRGHLNPGGRAGGWGRRRRRRMMVGLLVGLQQAV